MGEHGAREWLDLSEPRSFEAEGLPGEAHGLDAAAHAAVEQRRVARPAVCWGARMGVHVGSPVRVAQGRWAGAGTLLGRSKAPNALRPSAREDREYVV